MSVSTLTAVERFRLLGAEYGRDLAAALVLASARSGEDRATVRAMARIVLREIAAAVDKVRDASIPAPLAKAYEQACRASVRSELMASRGQPAEAAGRQAA